MKTCTKCKLEKALTEFGKNMDKLRPDCKECCRAAQRARIAADPEKFLVRERARVRDPEKVKAWGSAYYAANKEERLSKSKARYQQHRDEILAKQRQDRVNNPTKYKESDARKYYKNPEKTRAAAKARADKIRPALRAYAKKYRAEHREELLIADRGYWLRNRAQILERSRGRQSEARAYAREHYRQHPEKAAARLAKRRALRVGAVGTCTADQLKARIDVYGGCCAYCGGKAESVDHVIPLARGGTNFPANIRPACKRCNSSKRDKKLSEWKPTQAVAA